MNHLTQCAILSIASCCLSLTGNCQNDGDHTITNAIGQTYMAPDLQIGLGLTAPSNFTMGLVPFGGALFSIRADQFPLNSAQQDNIFQTRGDASRQSIWSLWRDTDQIGRIFCNQAATNIGFNVQATRRGGAVLLRNRRGRPNYALMSSDDEVNGSSLRLGDDSPDQAC